MAYAVVGRTVPRVEGPLKVTGAARFTADVELSGLLEAKVLRSPHPHARIVRGDLSRALALPGVVAAISGFEIPDVRTGKTVKDMPILCRDRVRYIGDPVAAVAAEDPAVAEEALGLIDVEYDELPGAFTPARAMAPGAPLLHPDKDTYQGGQVLSDEPNVQSRTEFGKGDVEQGFAESDRIFEHTFTTQRIHQAYIEPRACTVQIGTDGLVSVWSSCKVPYSLRDLLAELFELPAEQVVVIPTNIGGDFGGKGALGPEPIAYYLARRTRRPVRLVLSYVEELLAANPRHPTTITVKTGIKNDGSIIARDVQVILDGGAYAAYKATPNVGLPSVAKAPGPYRMPHARVQSRWVYTNNVPSGIMRAPGHPQVIFASESQIDIIARELGMDPIDIRMKNLLHEGDTWPSGERFEGVMAEATLRLARQASGWDRPLPAYSGRGVAMTDRPINAAASGTVITADADDGITVLSGIPDVGTGAFTIMKQVVAEQLQVPLEAVRVISGDTNTAPLDAGIGGSKTTYSANASAVESTTLLKQILASFAAEHLECAPDDLELLDGAYQVRGHPGSRISLLNVAREAAAASGGKIETRSAGPTGGRPPNPCFVATVVEVEVDPDTGRVTPTRLTAAHDVGFIINPQLLQAQIDGGLIQSLGFATMEELRSDDGRVSTLSFSEYKIPVTSDVPELMSVFVEGAPGPGPYEAKAVGELSLPTVAPALAGAVEQATGVRIFDLPVTAEKVYRGLERALLSS